MVTSKNFRNVIACAIVKNEERQAIESPLEDLSVIMGANLIGCVIHDTGSDEFHEIDPGIVQGVTGVATRLKRRPFGDFSSARNACLDDARRLAKGRAAWLLMFSAGAVFSGEWTPQAGPAMAHTERCGEFDLLKVGPIRVGSSLRYEGRTHEVITPDRNIEDLPHCGLTVDYSRDYDPEKKAARRLLDIELLKDDYSPRGRFYLAQSFDLLGAYHEAFAYYMVRAEQKGYEPERLQAVCGAIKTAPTVPLARFAHMRGDWCADVSLALAEREARERNRGAAASMAAFALTLETRSMFKNRGLVARCAEIIRENTEP
jgi:hypothetical protein